jgi:hypothetical protein
MKLPQWSSNCPVRASISGILPLEQAADHV